MSNVSDERVYYIGYEIQHIFVTGLSGRENNSEGAMLLRSIGFNLDARGNQLALLRSTETRDAVLAAPNYIRDVFLNAGFGWNIQYSVGKPSAHPEYNALGTFGVGPGRKQVFGAWD